MSAVIETSSDAVRAQLALPSTSAVFRLMAVEVDGLMLEHVPVNDRDYALCRSAVDQNWRALRFTPRHHYTREIFLSASAQNSRAIHYIPQTLRSREFFRELLHLNPHALAHFPKEWRTAEMCSLAAELDGTTYHYAPNVHKTTALKEIAEQSIADHLYEILGREEKVINQCKIKIEMQSAKCQTS